MSLWGKTASTTLTGTGSVTANTNIVVGSNTAFTEELSVSNVVSLDDTFFRVVSITDDEEIVVSPVSANAITSETILKILAPTFVSFEDLDETVLVTTAEAQTEISRDLGIKTPGWNKVNSYTDAQGKTRSKVENLVVFKS